MPGGVAVGRDVVEPVALCELGGVAGVDGGAAAVAAVHDRGGRVDLVRRLSARFDRENSHSPPGSADAAGPRSVNGPPPVIRFTGAQGPAGSVNVLCPIPQPPPRLVARNSSSRPATTTGAGSRSSGPGPVENAVTALQPESSEVSVLLVRKRIVQRPAPAGSDRRRAQNSHSRADEPGTPPIATVSCSSTGKRSAGCAIGSTGNDTGALQSVPS